MALVTITINGQSVEAEPGRRLVEVIKEQGVAITNLCYIDGLEPYAGCRTCLVEIEGGRPTPMQLSCTAQVAEGMVVRTDTPQVREARQGVMSLIMANHPDRCLTCHRRVHCQPGEICLRDDVVTHRCLTCAKNYRCELQTSTEMIDMGEFQEPWVGEERSYYETPPPEVDRVNPFLEFDPQMCIICTRCVRACADIRHTGAISLSGKGSTTAIAFGAGGAVHESDCNFCGSCIDVCPTATLMEKPNKWVGLAEEWTNSACNGCSVGCTISYGTSGGRPVIVRPDRLHGVSRDQICVRGRFGYEAVEPGQRLTRSLARRGEQLLPVPTEEALTEAAAALRGVREAHGPGAIAVLGSPLVTTEEALLLGRLAGALGTPHLDWSGGPLHRAVESALRDSLGVERRPADLARVEQADAIVVLAGDLEASHQVAALRAKDAVVKRGARLVVISPRWNELVRHAAVWLRPAPGLEAQAAQALAAALGSEIPGEPPRGVDAAAIAEAATALGGAERAQVIFAPTSAPGAAVAGAEAQAAANLAIALTGAAAAGALHYLPVDANVHGVHDAGVTPGDGGHDFPAIIEAAQSGAIHALVVHADNPLLSAPGAAATEAALRAVDTLVVIDSLRSQTAEHAQVVLAEVPFFAKDGTLTTADRRVVRQRPAQAPRRDERTGLQLLAGLAGLLGSGDVAAEIDVQTVAGWVAQELPGYPALDALRSGRTRTVSEDATSGSTVTARPLPELAAPGGDGLRLATGRPLYTSWEGASIGAEDADPLHREEALLLHPQDAEAAGARDGDVVVLTDGEAELRVAVRLDDGIAPGTVYLPQYYDGGATMRLFPLRPGGAAVTVRVLTPQPA